MKKFVIPEPFQPLFFYMQPDARRYRYYMFPGGRSSGKTNGVALALITEAAAKPTRILCGREYQNSIRDSVKRVLEDVIKNYEFAGFHSTNDSLTHENGSEFIFKGLHNDPETVLKGLEGVDRCWIEEAQFISSRSLDVLIPTIRKDGSTIIFTYNQLTNEDAVVRKFITHASDLDRERTYVKHTTWRTLEKAGLLSNEVRLMVEAAALGVRILARLVRVRPEDEGLFVRLARLLHVGRAGGDLDVVGDFGIADVLVGLDALARLGVLFRRDDLVDVAGAGLLLFGHGVLASCRRWRRGGRGV